MEQRVNKFRRRYLQVETVFEFYGHAVRARTTARLAELLRAYDLLATQSMDAILRPLGIQTPPSWSTSTPAWAPPSSAQVCGCGMASQLPAAAIKLTRFNIYRPTSMLHEAGHQVAHLTGWNDELRLALGQGIPDPMVARAWEGWATELGPDLIAFAHAGDGAVAALHDVVMGDPQQVFNYPLGDPHPIAFLRVLVGIQMCAGFSRRSVGHAGAIVAGHPPHGCRTGRSAAAPRAEYSTAPADRGIWSSDTNAELRRASATTSSIRAA